MPSIREALDAGYDKIDAAPVEEAVETTSTTEAPVEAAAAVTDTPAPAETTATERPRDEAGRFTKSEKSTVEAKPVRATAATPPPAAGKTTGTAAPQTATASVAAPVPVAPALKPPSYWKATERELWGKTPAEVQQLINRYDREREIALQRATESAKGASTWTEAIRPYEAQIRASGQEPHAYVGNLLQTAHALSYGAPEQKAAVLADIVASFGVPPEILDRALVAKLQGQPMQQQAQQFRDPRFDRFLADLEQRKAARDQEQVSEATTRMEAFGESHEFYSDVRDQMADILDVWSKKGMQSVTDADLERAYNLACSMDEEVSAAMQQRKQAETLKAQAEATARARQAASGVKPETTGTVSQGPKDLRSILSRRADELGING